MVRGGPIWSNVFGERCFAIKKKNKQNPRFILIACFLDEIQNFQPNINL